MARPTVADLWVDYVETHAVAIEPPDLKPGNPLFDALAERELILMGESTHGTHEYYQWRADISKALIKHAGFRFIAVEGDWSAIAELDRYVRHLPGHADSANAVLRQFDRWPQWMWANPVIESLAEWLHAFNLELPEDKRVGIHGIDVYGWGDSLAALPGALEKLQTGWGAEAETQLRELIALQGDNDAFYRAVMRQQLPQSGALDAIYAKLEANKTTLAANNRHHYWHARQKTGLIRQAERHLRKNVARHPQSWNPRAENFVQTLERLKAYYGEGARAVLWAHNTHIGDARHTPMRQAGMITVGQQARERFGEDAVYLLGFASERGTFRAGRHWGARGEVMQFRNSNPISINHWLNRGAPSDTAWIPLQAARDNPRLRLNAGHRAAGVTFDPSQPDFANYVPSNIPMRYDGLIFIRETTALDGLVD